MVQKQRVMVVVFLFSILLVACTAVLPPDPVDRKTPIYNLPGNATPTVTTEIPALAAARASLAAAYGIEPSTIQVMGVEPVDWRDSCLEIQIAGQSCLQVVTPGYRILLLAAGGQVEYRSNLDGTLVMPANLPPQTNYPAPVQIARQMASDTWLIPAEEFLVVYVENVDWSNGCLGVERPNTACTEAIVPGYRIVMEAQGMRYEYHTDQLGNVIVEASSQQPALGAPQLTWVGGDEECRMAHINERGMDYGVCGGTLAIEVFSEPQHAVELLNYLNAYTTFTAQTSAGRVELRGLAQPLASPAEQRSVAEWAAALVVDRLDGDSGAGIAFRWKRTGGIAGFCDELIVYRSGYAEAASCKDGGQSLGKFRVSPAYLDTLYGYLDTFKPFSRKETDPATADAMTLHLEFFGRGEIEPVDADRASLMQFASDLFTQIP